MARRPGLGRRLRILTEYAGARTQKEMTRRLGISLPNWSNTLNRTDHDLSKEVALRIHKVFPAITLEWLWLGETHHMTAPTLNKLRKAAARIGEKFE